MALTNYTTLQASITNWLVARPDLAAVIPDFITLAEAEFNRRLRCRDMLVRATAAADGQFLALPDDFLEMKAIQVAVSGGSKGLQFLTQSDMDKYRLNLERAGLISANPQEAAYYTLHAAQIEFCPVPGDGDVVEMTYYGAIPALSGSNATNWLLTRHPDLYLYGSLLHAAPYLEEDERVAVWGANVERIIAAINEESDRAEFSGGPLIVRRKTFG